MIFKRFSFYLALAGVAGAVLLVRQQRTRPPAPPPLAEPTRSPYATFVAATGIIEARRENVAVATPKPGLVTAVLVGVGTAVTNGQPLLRLDDREADAAVTAARAQLAALGARRRVEQVGIDDWTDRFARVETLSRDSVASEDDLKRTWFALETAKAALVQLDAEIDARRADLHRAEVARDVLTVRAPRDGRVLQLNIRAGEYAVLAADKPLLVMGDVTRLQVRADVDEQNAPLVVPGTAATAFLKGSNDKRMPLEFVRVEPFVVPKKSLTGDSAERVDTRVLQLIYELNPPEFPVYVGQQVDVFIERPRE
ncbi:MAG: efflux RND transporter periplasmic adaptor subunit [Limisphaerales bacterium]